MIALRSLVGAVAFQRRSLETLASRRSLPFGAVCLLVGFTAYVGVRTAVYGGLMPDDPAEGGWWSPGFFARSNIVQLFLYLSAVYVPALGALANAFADDGLGLTLSRDEYVRLASGLLPLWGALFLATAPVQRLAPQFLVLGALGISIGLAALIAAWTACTIRALEIITAISRPLAAGVFALSALTAPVFLLLTGFPQAAVLLLLAVGGAEGLRAVREFRRRRAVWRRLGEASAHLRRNPEEAEAVRRVAQLHLELGNRAAALRYLEDALRKHPGRLDLRYHLARAMDMQASHAEALLHYGTVFEQDPEYDDGRIRLELAKARIHAGDASGGARLLETYLERQPGDLEARYRLAQARHMLADREGTQAQLDLLRRQARSRPRSQRARNRKWVIRARALRADA